MIGLIRSEAATPSRAQGIPLQFRFLHVVGFLMTLPVVAMARIFLSDRLREPRDESVFAETNRTVLTALGIAFMA